MKKSRGVSYIELLIAMALFAIALLAIIPTLSQAGRNMQYAQEAYAGHLEAGRIMLVVRDALADGIDPTISAKASTANELEFSFWIFGQNSMEFHTVNAPEASSAVSGTNAVMAAYASVIVAVVWGAEGQISGRAIGIFR